MKYRFGKLEIIVLITGFAVLVLELLAARILAPYLGNSIYIWAALIGVILGALSLGYYIGGYFSQKSQSWFFLSNIIYVSGIYILFLIIVREPILIFTAALGIKAGSVVAALALFAIPTLLLGMVSPYALRLKIKSVEESGEVAGNLYAISTLGSILGAFLAGFYLIPHFSTNQVLLGIAASLFFAALITKFRFLFLVLAIIVFLTFVYSNQKIVQEYVYEADSAYNHIRVVDAFQPGTLRPVRVLYLATESHSVIYRDSNQLFPDYIAYFNLDSLFNPKIESSLTLGGGAYVWPMEYLKKYPDSQMAVVEIDPKVTEVAKEFFRLTDSPNLEIITEDARVYLNNNQKKFDSIYGDAFASYYSIPFQLTTKQATEKVNESLSDDGVFILNTIGALSGKKSAFFYAEYNTIAEIFPQVYIFPETYYSETNDLSKLQNIIIVASKNPQRLTYQQLQDNASPQQKELASHLFTNLQIEKDIKVLTDEFAPVDYYIGQYL